MYNIPSNWYPKVSLPKDDLKWTQTASHLTTTGMLRVEEERKKGRKKINKKYPRNRQNDGSNKNRHENESHVCVYVCGFAFWNG